MTDWLNWTELNWSNVLLWAASHQLDAIRFISLCSQFVQFSSVLSVVSIFLQSHGLQHVRLPYPSPTLGAYSSSCPSTWWCHPTISSCLPLLCLPSIFPNIRVFSNGSVLPIRWANNWSFSFNISPSSEYSGWIFFFLGWTGLTYLQSKGLSRVFSNTIVPRAYVCVICQWRHIPRVGI